jgi:hypothetical protein
MNKFGLYYIYTWKHHKETSCIAFLNKQKCLFLKNGEKEGKTSTIYALAQWEGEDIRKGYRRVNMVEIRACVKMVK